MLSLICCADCVDRKSFVPMCSVTRFGSFLVIGLMKSSISSVVAPENDLTTTLFVSDSFHPCTLCTIESPAITAITAYLIGDDVKRKRPATAAKEATKSLNWYLMITFSQYWNTYVILLLPYYLLHCEEKSCALW